MKNILLIFILIFTSCITEPIYNNIKPINITDTGDALIFRNRLNIIRDSLHLTTLVAEQTITRLAQEKAQEMFDRDTLTHDFFWMRSNETGAEWLGECVVKNIITPESQVAIYMSSEDHKNVLLKNDATYIGYGKKENYQCTLIAKYK